MGLGEGTTNVVENNIGDYVPGYAHKPGGGSAYWRAETKGRKSQPKRKTKAHCHVYTGHSTEFWMQIQSLAKLSIIFFFVLMINSSWVRRSN